jgi:hypothetical protein
MAFLRAQSRPRRILTLAALMVLEASLGTPAFARQGQGAEPNAERSSGLDASSQAFAPDQQSAECDRSLEVANKATGDAEQDLPQSPVRIFYPQSSGEYKQKRKRLIAIVDELRKADGALSACLMNHPNDLPILWTQVHFDVVKRQLPLDDAGKAAAKPNFLPSPERDPMKTLDHILELTPGEPEVYYRKAMLFASPDLRGLNAPPDLASAIEFARKAVQGAPAIAWYRESLAEYLLQSDDDRGAMEVLQPLEGGHHPAYLLLHDLVSFPLPPGAVADRAGSSISAQLAAVAGKTEPGLRARAFNVGLSAAEIETFYRDRWKDFLFSSEGKEEMSADTQTIRRFVAYFEWQDDQLQITDPSRAEEAEKNGMIISLTEYRLQARSGANAPSVHCLLMIFDGRQVPVPGP